MAAPLRIGRLTRWLLPLLVVATLMRVGDSYVEQSWTGPGPLPQPIDVVVPRGTTEVVGQALHAADIIDGVLAFRIAALLTASDGALHAGEFAFPAHGSLRDVLRILRHGRQVEHHLTIPEGLTAKAIAALINQAPALTGKVDPPAEGAILPNTYDYLFGTARSLLLAHAEHALTAAMAQAWPARAPNLPLDSPAQAVTLASIVERETAKPAERAMVAAVYLNRLRAGMKLQADPTVIYGMGERYEGDIRTVDLRTDGPYNSYTRTGLPPTPIALAGAAAIRATARPEKTDALYFVASPKGDGSHVFSATLEQHNAAVAAYLARKRP